MDGAEGGRSGQGQRRKEWTGAEEELTGGRAPVPGAIHLLFSSLFSSQGFLFSIGVQWFDYDMLGGACVHPVGSLLKFSKL